MPKREGRLALEAFEKSIETGFGFVDYKGKSYMMALKEIPSKEESLKMIDETTDKFLKQFEEEYGGKQ